MIICICVYFIAFSLTLVLKKRFRLKVKVYPDLMISKDGLTFVSHEKHKLKINGAKVLQVGEDVYLKKYNKIVCLKNVDNVFVYKDYLYFKALGEVKLKLNLSNILKYFTIEIESKNIDMKNFKKLAIVDIKNHIFNLKNAKNLKKYIKTIKNIFKIQLLKNEILITKNKFGLSFVVNYFSCGKKKRVKVN